MLGKDNRGFNPMAMPGLSEEAKRSVGAAFDAMNQWRGEVQATTDRSSQMVFDRMAQAAKAMGWPAEIVETTRMQMQAMSRMQVQMIDQVMQTWEEQIKSPNPAAAMQQMMSKLQSFPVPGFGSMPGMPGMPGGLGAQMPGGMPMNPFQFWMQVGEQWQKNWAQAMSYWQQPPNGQGGARK